MERMETAMAEKGKLIVISGPSGAGKSSVVFKAIEGREDMCFSTSATTRSPRPGEQDGREYFFVDRERFQAMIDGDELLEYAQYVGNFYGTPRAYVEQQLARGMNVILDIEVQGARQVKEKMPDAVMIFIVPPDLEELRRRLIKRGTDAMDVIDARLERAKQEYLEAGIYDYIIVNDDLSLAAKEFDSIIRAEHCRASQRLHLLAEQ